VKVVNIVAIASVREEFDLSQLSEKNIGVRSPSSKPRWVKMRLAPENYYVAFYKSGKFLITGASDFKVIDNIAERVLRTLQAAGIEVNLESITIHNIVVTDTVILRATLEQLAKSLRDSKVSYEPEQFPALFYKDPAGMSYTLFSSGKIVVTGVTDLALAKRGIERFKALVTT
jgi:transcription initiation factor TFIID TATA-box-binding protein